MAEEDSGQGFDLDVAQGLPLRGCEGSNLLLNERDVLDHLFG
jgi:hypothetical protein